MYMEIFLEVSDTEIHLKSIEDKIYEQTYINLIIKNKIIIFIK